jgi:hypothetical protein
MQISPEEYKKCFDGYQIIDCVVRKKDNCYFLAKKMYDVDKKAPPEFDLTKRVIPFFASKPAGKRWSKAELNNFDHLCAEVSLQPTEQLVCMDLAGSVYAVGGGQAGMEATLAPFLKGGPLRGSIEKLRSIDGYVYAVGGNRSAMRREGKDNWLGFTKDFPKPEGFGQAFEDIDGFHANDLYCVGGKGDVWHYDGKTWKQLAFPSNVYLSTVCCAEDGFVYIGAQRGWVFKGKGDVWQCIHKDTMTLAFKDMVAYQGKVWCTSDYGLWEIEGDKVKESTAPAEVRACSGNLSVGDGVLLIAGLHGVALHDGTRWEILVETGI